MQDNQIAKDYICTGDNLLILGAMVKVYSGDQISICLPRVCDERVKLVSRGLSRAHVMTQAQSRIRWLRKVVTQSTIPSSSAYLVLDTVLIQYLWLTGEVAFVQDSVRLIQLNNLECPVVGEMEIEGHVCGVAAASYEVFRKPTVLVCFYSRGKYRVQYNYQLEV